MLCVRCVLCVLVCVCVFVVCGGVWCVVWHAEKNLRVYIQNVPVCTGTTRTCVTTCGRGVGTHGDVLNLHTEVFWTDTRGVRRGRERRGRSPSFLLT